MSTLRPRKVLSKEQIKKLLIKAMENGEDIQVSWHWAFGMEIDEFEKILQEIIKESKGKFDWMDEWVKKKTNPSFRIPKSEECGKENAKKRK